ncbi:MAG: hypothetical protein AAFQ99_03525, partial [Pseudomonadota bacterium]
MLVFHPGRGLRLLPAAVLAALSINASAQDDDVEEIIIEGRYLSFDELNSVKTPTPVLDVPQSLSILTAAQIEEQAFQ